MYFVSRAACVQRIKKKLKNAALDGKDCLIEMFIRQTLERCLPPSKELAPWGYLARADSGHNCQGWPLYNPTSSNGGRFSPLGALSLPALISGGPVLLCCNPACPDLPSYPKSTLCSKTAPHTLHQSSCSVTEMLALPNDSPSLGAS